jgi:NAD(P)-dependent dehydrogenase (short-subunit alcohol dehydrogenase family)
MNFDGRTVMITGPAGHLGRAVTQAFADCGARTVLVDRRRERLESVFGPETAQRLYAPADLLDRGALDAAVREAIGRCGRIDALCHLAGGFRMGEAVHETTDETWSVLFDLNVRTFARIAHAVVPHMIGQGGGSIVAVGAAAAQKGVARMGAYCAVKAGVVRLAEAMSAELRDSGINVNCVLPSVIDTPDNRAAMPDADPARWVAPADLARVVVFLASDAVHAVHGAALPVTGLG